MKNRNSVNKCGVGDILIGLALVGGASGIEAAPVQMSGPFTTPEYFAVQHYAYSPLPEICSGLQDTRIAGGHCVTDGTTPAGTLVGGLHKFVDGLPRLSTTGGCSATTPNAVPSATASPYNPVTKANNLGHCLIVASPDQTTFGAKTISDVSGNTLNLPASDYYHLELVEYSRYMHSDLKDAPTNLRGYMQLPTAGNGTPNQEVQYLSPVIIAAKGRPTRVKFTNGLKYEIPLPVDQSYYGAGSIDYNGTSTAAGTPIVASTKRSNLHLHGGDTPWISDGTPHTWITPLLDTSTGTGAGYAKGLAFQNVPDMVTNGWLLAGGACAQSANEINECYPANLQDGAATYYYPNGQTSRTMFYHDHSFGITRLNVYMGEASPYLLADPVQEEALRSMGVPGAIGVTPGAPGVNPGTNTNTVNLTNGNLPGQTDLDHLIPLVIQDKTFVPDNGQPGGQLAAQDPTWPAPYNAKSATTFNTTLKGKYWLKGKGSKTRGWGRGSLWLPHVYVTNQLPIAVTTDLAGNPITPSTVAPIGRWDYTPWMGAPLQINQPPVACTTTAYPGVPFSCPAMANPTAVPESFMDTITVNGTVYPHLDVAPDAYRFKILNASDDRFLNIGMYIAVTQDPIATIVDTTPAPVAPGPGMGAMADATIVGGVVTGFQITDPGANYPASPVVQITNGRGNLASVYVTVASNGGVLKLTPEPTLAGTGFNVGDTVNVTSDTANAYGIWTVSSGNCQGAGNTNCSVTGLTLKTGAAKNAGLAPAKIAVKVSYGIEPIDYAFLTANIPGFAEAKGIATVNSTGQVIDVMTDPTAPGAGYIAGGTSCENVPTSQIALCTEVAQVYPHIPPNPCTGTNALLPGMDNMGLVHVNGLSLGRTGMASNCYPDTWPQDGNAHSGLVPDPAFAGPPIIELGNEGGLLPAPVIIPSTPISYNYNRKMATVLGIVGGHGLDMAPAQRVDAVVDFHGFAPATAGNTTVLIAYNDHPAPAPLFDTRYDMYTGDPDNSASGGAPSTLPGFGPNTRTMVQIRISGNSTNNPIGLTRLKSTVTGIPALFASTQDKILIPQPNYPQNGLAKVGGGTDPGNGYSPTWTTTTFNTNFITNTVGGVSTPVVLDYKAILEGFDPIWGTLNVELGDSIPVQGTNTINNYLTFAAMPFGYVDPPSELLADGGVANWRIDHIGVDAHALHFHLFNVQIVNYLDVAGQIYMPDSNQLGWNETVRTEPFTSAVVALYPKNVPIPWELPNSIHALDTTTNLGAVNGPVTCINNPFALQAIIGPTCVPFTQVDPTGNAVNITNALVNFGSEYVYHCHLLSHEEHDMMRPISFAVAPKNAPTLARSGTDLIITDHSFNETDFIIEQSTNGGTTWTVIGDVPTGTGTTTGTSVGKTTRASLGTTVTMQSLMTQSGNTPPAGATGPCIGVNNPVGCYPDPVGPVPGTVGGGVPVPVVSGTSYRVTAANIVGCNWSVPALPDGTQVTGLPACSDIFTGWPSIIAKSPVSNTVN